MIRSALHRWRPPRLLRRAVEAGHLWIQYRPDGRVERASPSFRALVGPRALDDDAMTFDALWARTPEAARRAWTTATGGGVAAGTFRLETASGAVRWLRGTLVPVRGIFGRRVALVSILQDATEDEARRADEHSRLEALDRSQAVIAFDLSGTILEANANFLATVGYTREEIVGRHHRMFVRPSYAASPEYADFWQRLGRGEPFVDTFPRVTKDGRDLYIQGSYNPLRDAAGTVYGVVKYVTDVTAQVRARRQLDALVAEARQVLGAVAARDLTQRIRGTYDGPLGQLATDINGAVALLRDTVRQMADTATTVATAVVQLAQGNEDLAQRTNRQASALEESTASLVEVVASVERTAARAQAAEGVSASASDDAQEGAAISAAAVAAMADVRASSQRVGEVTRLIRDIAFQTNLLALNAAVEAARAGEHGRGFSVVAEEVRTLARRAATASTEIESLIEMTLQQVANGHARVEETGTCFAELREHVASVSGAVRELATASRGQADGLTVIFSSVRELDGTSQANAALVQELSATHLSLKREADRLLEQVAGFALESGASPKGSPPVTATREALALAG